VVVAKNTTTTRHGAIKDKTQTRETKFYNLDVIIFTNPIPLITYASLRGGKILW
jgi:hypothetical protein